MRLTMKNIKNIKLIIAYDGSNYSGWQRQKDKKSIQGTIENTIKLITGEKKISLDGSGRTDAGVHAIGQVANFFTKSFIPIDKWPIILNHQLPGDIRVKYAKQMNQNFHARYCAKSRIYRYYILNRCSYNEKNISVINVFARNYCFFFPRYLDVDRMRETADYLVGYHDFSALSCINQKKGESIKNKFRKIKRIRIIKENSLICFSFEADAFLYKMVRVIIGTLIDFSIHHREPKEIIQILKNKNNQQSGKVIPPCGLYLIKVKYQ